MKKPPVNTHKTSQLAIEAIVQSTPGPWEYADFGYIVGRDPKGIHPDIYIAEIVDQDDEDRVAPFEHLTPNAYLIAAAPELLKAAEIADELIKLIEKWADAEQCDSYAIMDEIVSIAEFERIPENAIAKARGTS